MTKTRDPHPTPECLLPPACERECHEIPWELPHYFSGRVLTARDMRDEQAFFLSRLRLRHRLFHGWGVVCGLDVCPHPDPACRDRYVVVKPGIAIDCCGNDIFVCEPSVLEIPPLPRPDPCPPEEELPKPEGPEQEPHGTRPAYPGADPQQAAGAASQTAPYPPPPEPKEPMPKPYPDWGPYVVCLQYVRHGIEPRPVLDDPGGCDAHRTAPTRMREGFHLKVVPHEDLGEDCWPLGKPSDGSLCKSPEAVDCFAPDCPCGDCVPLALLTYGPNGPKIEMLGRPEVITTLRRHTRIASINWPHGGEVPTTYLRNPDQMGGRFEVGFSAPVAKTDPQAGTGISRFSFEVTFSGVQRDVEFLPRQGDPELSDDGCKAWYRINDDLLAKIEGLGYRDFRVRILGDFVLDTNGHPIDADFLRGRLPTGNGTAGGVFQSWLSTRS